MREPLKEELASWAPVTLSRDNTLLALARGDNHLQLSDAATGKALYRIPPTGPGPYAGNYAPTFSPDGQFVLSTGSGSLFVWNAKTGEKKREAPCGGRVAFSPDGRRLAVAADRSIRLLEWPSLTEIRRFDEGDDSIGSLAFSPDGKWIVSGQAYTVALWDVATGKQVNFLPGEESPVLSLAFSADGRFLASGGDRDGTAYIWDVAAGKSRRQFTGHYIGVRSLAFSPDGAMLASGDGTNGSDHREAQIRLWDVNSGRVARQFFGHLSSVQSLAFAPDGKTLASSGWDARVRLWDPATGNRLRQIRGADTEKSLAFAPDGSGLLVAERSGGKPLPFGCTHPRCRGGEASRTATSATDAAPRTGRSSGSPRYPSFGPVLGEHGGSNVEKAMNQLPEPSRWTLGLGQFTALANTTAVAVVLLMFYQTQQRFYDQSTADRQMFREELRLMHQDSQRQWDAICENQKATGDLAVAVRDLAEEVRRRSAPKP